ncbi:MAG: hypothetical protein ACYDCO_06075 [Armatimonadota bacterium]
MAKQTPQVLAVGDHIRLKARDNNQHQAYRAGASEVVTFHEPVDGLVLSIRDVSSGQLRDKTKGALDQYVIEIVYSRTFNPRYASLRNAARGVEDPTTTGGWRKLRAVLRKSVEEGKLFSAASPEQLAAGPLANLLDGWKVVKVWSQELETLEKAEEKAAGEE